MVHCSNVLLAFYVHFSLCFLARFANIITCQKKMPLNICQFYIYLKTELYALKGQMHTNLNYVSENTCPVDHLPIAILDLRMLLCCPLETSSPATPKLTKLVMQTEFKAFVNTVLLNRCFLLIYHCINISCNPI